MQAWEKWLRSYGAAGNAVAATLALLGANWLVGMSVLAGLLVAFWEQALAFAMTPSVYAGIGAFLAVLWTLIGVLVLYDRRKPRTVKTVQDYAYGLTCEGVHPHYDADNAASTLSFMVLLRNFSQAPIFYIIKKFDVRFGKRSLPPVEENKLKAYLARGGGKGSRPVPFDKDDIKDFMGKEVKGTIVVEIVYGHPLSPPVRRLTITYDVTCDFSRKDGLLGFAADVVNEVDEAI